jgi:hypothetical protein
LRTEPALDDTLAPLWQRLRETIAWCRPRVRRDDPRQSLRSNQTRPRVLERDYFAAVSGVALSRRSADATTVPLGSLEGGRLLVYFPDLDLACGAAEAESAGYFDLDNAPAWDTWVAMLQDDAETRRDTPYLVAWVPAELVALADRGIHVNPEECIQWLDHADVHLRTLLVDSSLWPSS